MRWRTGFLILIGIAVIGAASVYLYPDLIADRVLSPGLKNRLRLAYRQVVYTALSATGHNPMCKTPEAEAGILSAARYAAEFTDRLVQEDSGMALYENPLGQFWIPKSTSLNDFHVTMAEGLADVYAFGKAGLKDAIVLDCGANVGSFTRTALNKGAKRVVAIEPTPSLVAGLRRSFAKEIADGRVVVYPKGVWDREDVLLLHTSKHSETNSFLATPGEKSAQEGVNVPLIPIDKMMGELGLERVDFIKMDIEGAESKALAGATETIRKFKPIMAVGVEHTSDVLQNAQNVLNLVQGISPGYRHNCIYCVWDERLPKTILPDVVYFQQ